MNEDKELEMLKQKKIKELMKRIENQNKQDDPKQILISRLVDRGDEVLKIAETYYPKETEIIVNQLDYPIIEPYSITNYESSRISQIQHS